MVVNVWKTQGRRKIGKERGRGKERKKERKTSSDKEGNEGENSREGGYPNIYIYLDDECFCLAPLRNMGVRRQQHTLFYLLLVNK